jgi:hypothetical protein
MFAIYDWFGYELPISERYRLIKKAGFDGVLLWWSECLDRNDYRSGPQIVREAGLSIENIHTPFQVQDNIWLDNLDGEAYSIVICNVLQIAPNLRFRPWWCICRTMTNHITHWDWIESRELLKRLNSLASMLRWRIYGISLICHICWSKWIPCA